MKENLILKKFEEESVNGTFELEEFRWFFGSKMLEIEDNVAIDNITIQYSEMDNGYQYYNIDEIGDIETFKTPNLNSLKKNNHNIKLSAQNKVTKRNNTKWEINIDLKEILKEYIFYKIKERRTFKGITEENLLNKNINNSIRKYIKKNVINRYKYNGIDFYVKYENLSEDQSVLSSTKVKFNPKFDTLIKNPIFKETNITTNTNKYKVEDLNIIYNQTKPSNIWRFNYYFDLYFQKI